MCGFTRGHLPLAWSPSFYSLSLWRVGHMHITALNTTCACPRTRGAPILNHSPGSTSIQVNGYNTSVACGPFRHLTQHICSSISPPTASGVRHHIFLSLQPGFIWNISGLPPPPILSPLLLGHPSFGLHLMFPCDDTDIRHLPALTAGPRPPPPWMR